MNDREFLELAAKAAGHTLTWADDGSMCWLTEIWEGQHNTDETWNPLRNDDDSLRLAVKLRIDIQYATDYVAAVWTWSNQEEEDTTDDPYAAVRRAIVRAAAEIGKTK